MNKSSNPPAKLQFEYIYKSDESDSDRNINGYKGIDFIYPGMPIAVMLIFVDMQGRKCVKNEWPRNLSELVTGISDSNILTLPNNDLIISRGWSQFTCDSNYVWQMEFEPNVLLYQCVTDMYVTSENLNLNSQLMEFCF